jgi:hydrogenase expression/formation protein HypC
MCLAIPLEIVELLDGARALVRQGDGTLEVDVSLLDDPQPGDHVLVHAGFALEVLDLQEASERLAMLRESEADAGR